MSLLGRLEDLSLTDIVQIVHLSRRTGVLEIVNDDGRHTVLFRHGLVVNASAPDHSDLATYLHRRGIIPADAVKTIRQMEDQGIPCGTAVVELNLAGSDTLAAAIRDRILGVVAPLLETRDGEFNFLLSESMKAVDLEYEPDVLFQDGGLSPQTVLRTAEGETLKPLSGLEDSLKAGKALRRSAPAPERQPPLDLGRGDGAPPPVPPAAQAQFKVAGGLFEVESPEAAFRNVVLFERNPLIRVAAKRAFSKNGVKIAQFGSIDEARSAIVDLFRSNSFFVTFLELTEDDSAARLLAQLKRRNPRLPVGVIDQRDDHRRRQEIVRAGADLYLTKPSPERLEPGVAEEELGLFAEELVLFAGRAFEQWEQMTGGGPDAGRRFYEQADKENLDRSFGLLEQLINEVSNPNDIEQVSETILRLAAQYFDRGALFVAGERELVGLGGFGITDGVEPMDQRVKRLRIARGEAGILAGVAESGAPHRGKMRRTSANLALIEAMGGLLPTEVVALPILHGDRAIGILYGDNAEHRAPIEALTGLEIFLSQAGYAFGNAAAIRGSGGGGGS
ncbi:MAG TPA: response regulator [Thermoanaerobaculia bacterium]|nr:response regulator [Thermoanaerobaculia bacterium]